MTDTKNTPSADQWTSLQAYTLAAVCLLIGIVGGWFVRSSRTQAAVAVQNVGALPADRAGAMDDGKPTPEQMKRMAEAEAAPLLEKLKSDPDDADLLAKIGNIFYDTQQYPVAIDYYQRALKVQPANTSVRTDLGTAMWYTGEADAAIAQFNQVLKAEPSKANALFNLGIVKWRGKMDVSGAVEAWQKLLDTNPTYENKQQVMDLIAQAKRHANLKPGTAAKPLPQ
jgi:cytochrome c-type biogenesis protein CcmH/NrfG